MIDYTDKCRSKGIDINKANSDFRISGKWNIAGTVLCIAAALLAIGSAVVTIYDLYKYYHQEYSPIPRKIVHESTDDKGRFGYTIYDVTRCNRAAQGFGNDDLGDFGDMNGDVGKQWLALFTTKDKAAGDPITADIVAQKGSNKIPLDKAASIRLFGSTDSLNIVDEEYNYNNDLGGLYIFFGKKSGSSVPAADAGTSSAADSSQAEPVPAAETISEADQASEAAAPAEDSSSEPEPAPTGSVVGTGTMIGSCIGSAAIGALICFLIVRMKRKETAA